MLHFNNSKSMGQVWITLAVSLLIAACSSVTPLTQTRYPAVAPERVEVLYQEPKRPFEVIAMISHEAATRFATVQSEIQNVRELAAEAGADAVIIASTYDQSVSTAAKASGKAIRWEHE